MWGDGALMIKHRFEWLVVLTMFLFLPNVVVALGFFSVYQELAHIPAFVLVLFCPHSTATQALEEKPRKSPQGQKCQPTKA